TPSSTDQKTRCQVGESSAPPEVSMSTTSEPESDEVTKKVTTSTVATSEETDASGSSSRKRNSATDSSAATASASPVMPCTITMWMAVSPNTVIHRNVKPSGTSSTPTMNWRMVRPREMRAMNMPTKGDQAIHQPQ